MRRVAAHEGALENLKRHGNARDPALSDDPAVDGTEGLRVGGPTRRFSPGRR